MSLYKASRRKVLEFFAEGLFLRCQQTFLTKSPVEAEKLGERLAMWWYALDRKHRRRCHLNLAMAFPDWGADRVKTTSKEVFRHFGRVGGDFMRSLNRTDQDVLDTTTVEGIEHLERAEAKGHGVLMVTGHLGNWERYAHWVVASGRQLTVVARDADQEGIQAHMLRMREAAGVEVLSRGNTARHALVKLKRNERIGILADQSSHDCFVPFFGYPCGTAIGPAVLHRRTGAALCPTFCIWEDYNRYRVQVMSLIDPDNTEEDAETVTAMLNGVLESVIRQYPTQWLWMHDRWKSARKTGRLKNVVPRR